MNLRNRSVLVLVSTVPFLAGLVALSACVGDDPVTLSNASDPRGGDGAAQEASDESNDAGDTTTTPDGGAPDAAEDASTEPKTFCDTQAPVTGVADFFCADFDGADLQEGFTRAELPDGGTLVRTTDLFASPPASLTTNKNAALVWEKAGATTFSELDVRFKVNVGNIGGVVPPSTGVVKVIELSSIDADVSIQYTRGGNIEGATYTGYYVQITACPGPCAAASYQIPTPLPTNAWTTVRIAWTSAGLVKVFFNDVLVLEKNGFSTTSTKVSTTLGLVRIGSAPVVGRHVFDDLVVSVKRN